MTVSVDRTFETVCLSVCLSAVKLKKNDPKVFKLGIGKDLEVICFWG